MFDDMSTSSQSSASVTLAGLSPAVVYDVTTAADDIIYQKQQQQQHPTSTASQRFYPYLVAAYDSRDLVSASTTQSVDHDSSRHLQQPQQQPQQQQQQPQQHLGTAAATSVTGTELCFSGRQTHDQVALSSAANAASRRLREFIPDHKKDQEYWLKRQKNNEAAKRSREKRRINDMVMTKKILELTAENKRLRFELDAIKRKYGLTPDTPFPIDAATAAAAAADDMNRSVSPACVGISSSDDSAPSSSFPMSHSASRSSTSPPLLDRCYSDPLASGKSIQDRMSPLAMRVPCSAQPYAQQPVDSCYRPQLPGQQFGLLQVQQQQQQQQQQRQPVLKACNSVMDSTAAASLHRPLQFTSTSAFLPAKNVCVRATAAAAAAESLVTNADGRLSESGSIADNCGRHLVQLGETAIHMESTQSLQPMPTPALSAMCSPSSGALRNPLQSEVIRAAVSAPGMPGRSGASYSDLSSEDDDDTDADVATAADGKCVHQMHSTDAPLNLTKRQHLPWNQSSMSQFCGSISVLRDTVTSLRNDHRYLPPVGHFREFLPSQIMDSDQYEKQSSSRQPELEEWPSTDSYVTMQGEHLNNPPTLREKCLFELSEPRLLPLPTTVSTNSGVKFESVMVANASLMNCLKPEVEFCPEDSRDDLPPVFSDSAWEGQVQAPNRHVRGGVPLKVWHKRSALLAAAHVIQFEQDDLQEVAPSTSSAGGDVRLLFNQPGTLPVTTSPNGSPSSDSVVNYSSDSDSAEAEHREKRLRNNVAARKCRENRKLLTGINLTAATILESENNKLKEELRSLSREVTDLKEMIGKKKKVPTATLR